MIDDGELDWKLIAIKSDDPLASQLNDIEDVERQMPGVVSGKLIPYHVKIIHHFNCFYYFYWGDITGIREWFRWYKTPDDKPLNKFGFDEKALNRAKALEVIEETHHHWKELIAGKSDKGKLWIADN